MIRPTINVIDMYHGNALTTRGHDGDPNALRATFEGLKSQGVLAIIHKVSQGTHYADPAYARRKSIAQSTGLLWGGYHFLDASDAEQQADWFIKNSGITDAGAEPFLLAADYENSPSQPSLSQLMTFMRAVDSVVPGVSCMLYSGNLIRETLKPHTGGHLDPALSGAPAFFQNHRLWLAEYGPKEQVPWPWCDPIVKTSDEAAELDAPGVFLWQFTERGRVNPLIGNTDGNFWAGTLDDLKARWLA